MVVPVINFRQLTPQEENPLLYSAYHAQNQANANLTAAINNKINSEKAQYTGRLLHSQLTNQLMKNQLQSHTLQGAIDAANANNNMITQTAPSKTASMIATNQANQQMANPMMQAKISMLQNQSNRYMPTVNKLQAIADNPNMPKSQRDAARSAVQKITNTGQRLNQKQYIDAADDYLQQIKKLSPSVSVYTGWGGKAKEIADEAKSPLSYLGIKPPQEYKNLLKYRRLMGFFSKELGRGMGANSSNASVEHMKALTSTELWRLNPRLLASLMNTLQNTVDMQRKQLRRPISQLGHGRPASSNNFAPNNYNLSGRALDQKTVNGKRYILTNKGWSIDNGE